MAAVAFCLLAPFIVFLTANNYSVIAVEVLPVYLVALASGLVVAALVKLRLVALANTALWGSLVLSVVFLYQINSVLSVLAVAFACGFALWFLKDNGAIVLLLAAVVHIGSTMALSMVSGANVLKAPESLDPLSMSPSKLPPVLHLVLDEFVGLHGLPSELSGSQELASELSDYYLGHGFKVFSHAYSQYTNTTNSLSNLVNFSSNSSSASYLGGSGEEFFVADNRYFEHMLALGYKLHVYQSNYLNFCISEDMPVSSCSSYKTNSIASIENINIPVTQKFVFIRNSFLDSSAFLRSVRKFYSIVDERSDINLPPWPTGNSYAGPLAVLPILADLKSAISELRPGEFHFAHLMLPHYPYNLQADCEVKPRVSSWLNTTPFDLASNEVERNSVASRLERYAQYMAQVECTQSIIEDLITIIQESGQWGRSIIIIHGDHGSRIVRRKLTAINASVLTEDDYRDAYSTFFVVKNGAAIGELDASPLPLQSLLATIWGISAREVEMGHVYLHGVDQEELQAAPLLGFGLPASEIH